jgi:hypothetical protein
MQNPSLTGEKIKGAKMSTSSAAQEGTGIH